MCRLWTVGFLVAGVAGLAAVGPPVVPDVSLYDSVLKKFVLDNGRVRYGELRGELGPLDTFVSQMAVVSPRSHPDLFPSSEARLAYWINAYNALVLRAFAREYPEGRDRLGGLLGRGKFFYRRKFTLGGEKFTLARIENDVIRKGFPEPRIHFALVCASESCPWLARDAYTAANLNEILDRETRRFLNQERNVSLDAGKKILTLSKLFDWYGGDFGRTQEDILAFMARYREDGDALTTGRWTIRFFDYDWSLNDAARPAEATPRARGASPLIQYGAARADISRQAAAGAGASSRWRSARMPSTAAISPWTCTAPKPSA